MTTYELFERDPIEAIIILLISLIITLVAYGAFPIIFAKMRKKSITRRKYNVLCYLVNFFVLMIFIRINGSSAGTPYIIWTSVFYAVGLRILNNKGVVINKVESSTEEQQDEEEKSVYNKTDKIMFCRRCGNKLLDDAIFCNKCGTEVITEEGIK